MTYRFTRCTIVSRPARRRSEAPVAPDTGPSFFTFDLRPTYSVEDSGARTSWLSEPLPGPSACRGRSPGRGSGPRRSAPTAPTRIPAVSARICRPQSADGRIGREVVGRDRILRGVTSNDDRYSREYQEWESATARSFAF